MTPGSGLRTAVINRRARLAGQTDSAPTRRRIGAPHAQHAAHGCSNALHENAQRGQPDAREMDGFLQRTDSAGLSAEYRSFLRFGRKEPNVGAQDDRAVVVGCLNRCCINLRLLGVRVVVMVVAITFLMVVAVSLAMLVRCAFAVTDAAQGDAFAHP